MFKKYKTKKYLNIIKGWMDIYHTAYKLKMKLCYDEIDNYYFVVVKDIQTYNSNIYLQLRKDIRKRLKNKFTIFFTFDSYCFKENILDIENTKIIYEV